VSETRGPLTRWTWPDRIILAVCLVLIVANTIETDWGGVAYAIALALIAQGLAAKDLTIRRLRARLRSSSRL
jgi:hypothetical protein